MVSPVCPGCALTPTVLEYYILPLLKGVSRLVFDAGSVLAVFVHIVSESEIYFIAYRYTPNYAAAI